VDIFKTSRREDTQRRHSTHDEPFATMLDLFDPHRGILANEFFGKRPGHDDLPGVT
jgi:hypothetical protein